MKNGSKSCVALRLGHADAGVGEPELDHGPLSSATTFAVSIVTDPPPGIASRALTARLTITCSSWVGSARIAAEARVEHRHELDVLADQPAQHRVHVGDDGVQVEHARLQHLPAAEREQLAGERCGARRGLLDLLGVTPLPRIVVDPAIRNSL